MRPHRLRLTAFGAFGGTVEVSFDDLASSGLFLPHGETGAGQTTLLDAIGFALYGQVPGERRKARRLRSDHAEPGTPTEVQLEATLGGRRMRITRKPEQERPKRRGTGTTTEQARILLEEHDGTTWHATSTRAGEADQEIADLMGMSADQFFQVVLLPQGQFAQFLHADAESRRGLLQRLFGTDRFRAVEEWLAERRKAANQQVTQAEQGIKEHLARIAQAADVPVPGDGDQAVPPAASPAGWAAGLAATAAAEAATCAERTAVHRRELDQAQRRQRDAERLADRQRRRRDAETARDELAAAQDGVAARRTELAAASSAAEVAPALAEAERTRTALARAHAAEARAREQAAAVDSSAANAAGANAAGLRAAGQEHITRVGRLDALRSISRQADDEDEAAAGAQRRAAELAAGAEAARQAAVARREQRSGLSQDRDAAREAGLELPSAQAEAARYAQAAENARELGQARLEASRQAEAYVSARVTMADVIGEAARLRLARIDGMRAELAATLVDGAPCPVCGSLDHPELCELRGERVTREQEEAADAEVALASERAENIGAKVAAADVLVSSLSARLEDAGFTAAEDLAALQAKAGELAATAARLAGANARLGELQTDLDRLDQDIAATDSRVVELTEQRESELRQAAEASQRAGRHRTSLLAQLDGQPDLETALSAAQTAADTLIAAADAADATARASAEAQRAGDLAAQTVAAAGFAGLDAARAAQRDAAWRAGADQAIREHEAASRAVAEVLADPDLDVPLDPPADVAGATAAVQLAGQAHEDALTAHDRAQTRAAQLAGLIPQLGAQLDEMAPLMARAAEIRRLADLAAGQGSNTLRMTLSSFVLAARLEEVAAAASERLLTMTSGRYSLVHTDARRGAGRSGLGLLACDTWTGVDRDTSTLSGGETFLASLALALGLADVVTAEAGGTRIEALFVDEGFGSLDEETLEEVMTVLDGLREGGRMVGIVSHVAELRQRIPAQIRVHKGHAGSHLTVRSQYS